MSLLPGALHVPADPVGGRDIAAIITLLAGEVGVSGAGSRAAVARLIDLLLIAAIRRWALDPLAGAEPSWLTVLRDPTVARPRRDPDRPAKPWMVETLAREVHLSRGHAGSALR